MIAANDNGRMLTRKQAAAYCGYRSVASFSRRVKAGTLPYPAAGMKRWDIKVLDAALDKISGLGNSTPEDAFDAWEREDDARQSQGGR